MDRYDDIATQIIEAIKGDEKKILDEDIQKKITDILKNNFSVSDEEMGKGLMKDAWLFDPESGKEFDAPIFTIPMFVPIGVKVVQPDTFPNYGINNKYIGYTEKEIFYKINDFTRFMRSARKNPIPVIAVIVLVYLMIGLLMIPIKQV